MHAVAACAVGDDDGAAFRGEAVVAVEVGGDAIAGDAKFFCEADTFMAARAGGLGEVLFGDRGVWIDVRFDGVDAVAIGAGGCVFVASGDGFAVDALEVSFFNAVVTLAAGVGDVEFVNGRGGIVGRENGVRVVAICADGSGFVAIFRGFAVDTLLVIDEGLCALAI